MIKKYHYIFFWRGGGQIIGNSLSCKIIYHKNNFSEKWFQNGFKIAIDLFGETVWKDFAFKGIVYICKSTC